MPTNPKPTLISMSPLSVLNGNALPITLTLNGTNFISSSVVKWQDQNLVTTYVSASQLTAVIPSSLTGSAKLVKIKVHNPAPGGGDSSPLVFAVTGNLIKVIKNNTNQEYVLSVPGCNQFNVAVVPGNAASFDLGSVLSSEDLYNIQPTIEDFVQSGAFSLLAYAPIITYNQEANPASSVPANLLSDVATLKTEMAAVMLQLSNSILMNINVNASEVDLAHSTIGIDVNGNFTLPTFTPQIYWQDTLSGSGPLNPANYLVAVGQVGGVGNPPVMENGACTAYSVAEGIYETIIRPTASAADPLPADWSVAFNLVWSSITPTGGDFLLLLGDGGDGHMIGRYGCLMDGIRDDAGNIDQFNIQVYNQVSGNLVLAQGISVVANNYNCLVAGGATIPMRFVSQQGLFSFFINGVLVASAQDPTPYVGTPYNDVTLVFGPGGFGGQIGWGPEMFAFNDLVIGSPAVGTYGASGTMQSLPLTATAPIVKASVSFSETLPALSTATVSISADGGTTWLPVTDGEVVSTTGAGGPSTSILVKVALASTDGTHLTTPVVGSVVASLSKV